MSISQQDGDAYGWGWARDGQLGCSSGPGPEPLSLPGPAASVVCGARHSLVRLADGRLYGAGLNDRGQLGTELPSTVRQWTEIAAPLPSAR